jgi:predicted alpha-1,2-mannosidase
MIQWSPDTAPAGISRPGGYSYADSFIRGFSLTHLSGAGCVAFGDVPFMPVVGAVRVAPHPDGSPYAARFDHAHEQASPGYYAVRLRSGISVQLTVTRRTGFARLTYPRGAAESLLIDAGGSAGARSNIDGHPQAGTRASWIQVRGNDEVIGSATSGGFCGLHNTYTVYFAARFDRPFSVYGTWTGSALRLGSPQAYGPRTGAFLTFDTLQNPGVKVQVGLSYVSEENALANIRAEDRGWNFGRMVKQAHTSWNRLLNRIQVTGGTVPQNQVFYTALYHAVLEPSVFSDANGQYMGFDGHVHVARGYTQYANFSGWDIYRTQIQLLAWLQPHKTADMMQSLVADARQGGWLPKWPIANDYTGEMDGDSADPILAEAYAFGARRFDARGALRFMLKGATQPGIGPGGYIERPGLREYLRGGYVPPVAGLWGPASTTLEYAIDDFSIAQMARMLGDSGTYISFVRRSANWKRLFNPATGFVEPVDASGSFPSNFNPKSMDGFVEGNAWQYSWMVPQDLHGLFHAVGGAERVTTRLDRFLSQFEAGPLQPYEWAGNEPGLGVPWEYDFAGKPWRTQAVVRRMLRQLYTPIPLGLPGNDDLGTLSAWYVWAALGLYPEIPGVAGFALSTPNFSQVSVHWGGHNRLALSAPGSSTMPYIRTLRLNGRPYTSTWLPMKALAGRATLQFTLAPRH